MLLSAAHAVLRSPQPIQPAVAYRLARTCSNRRVWRTTLLRVRVCTALETFARLALAVCRLQWWNAAYHQPPLPSYARQSKHLPKHPGV
jgi:hypothetical protein